MEHFVIPLDCRQGIGLISERLPEPGQHPAANEYAHPHCERRASDELDAHRRIRVGRLGTCPHSGPASWGWDSPEAGPAFEFEGDKIVRVREYNDTAHVFDTLRAGQRRRTDACGLPVGQRG